VDTGKCKALKTALERQPEPWIVTIELFFDGNDDTGSIGWNLPEHPGVDAFRDLLTGLQRSPDVLAIYARMVEMDAGEDDCWPSTDIIFVVGATA